MCDFPNIEIGNFRWKMFIGKRKRTALKNYCGKAVALSDFHCDGLTVITED